MPKPPGGPTPVRGSLSEERKRVQRAETIGILLLALAILAYAVLRYSAHINWSAR
jgi:hypothetical protein